MEFNLICGYFILTLAVLECQSKVNLYVQGQSKPIIKGTMSANGVYPISGSFFKDRFTLDEWNTTLQNFSNIGGDTVILRAPPIVIRSPNDIKKDPDFQWCHVYDENTGKLSPHCVSQAISDLSADGLIIDDMATYTYEEDFNWNIMICPKYERWYQNSRIYFRLVLPADDGYGNINPCNAKKGDHVIVLFTMFSGVDPRDLLLKSAQANQMSVYFGLPAAPRLPSGHIWWDYMPQYYGFVWRVLQAHELKYHRGWNNSLPTRFTKDDNSQGLQSNITLYDSLKGYFSKDEVNIAKDLFENDTENNYLKMYTALGNLVKCIHLGVGSANITKPKKKFMISPYIILNKSYGHYSLQNHTKGFTALLKTGAIDIIAVQEGRGHGRAPYYWDTEEKMQIVEKDPVLAAIVQKIDPTVSANATFKRQFTASINKVFEAFSQIRDSYKAKNKTEVELWLSVEAFEYLRADQCLPIDASGSGMDQILNRAAKSRVDWAIANAGFFPQKIISFAWDSDFLCKTRTHQIPLMQEIYEEATQWSPVPIISYCGYHSKFNMSTVVIGYGMTGLTQSFDVTYTTREGEAKTESDIHGYYYEMDYGPANDRPGSLMYIQLYDVMDPYDIAMKGTLKVTANSGHTYCINSYDFT